MANQLKIDIELDAKGYKAGAETASYATQKLQTDTEEYIKSFGSLRKQLGAAKKDAQNLAAQFAALGKAEKESEYGQELAENLQIAIEKAAELQDVMADTNDAIKNAASDTAGLDALKESMEIGKEIGTAYIGVLGRLAGSEKDLQKVVSSLAAVQGTFNAAIKTANALQKNSATMIALQRAGVISLTQAEKISTVATNAATVATKALGMAMKALPYVGIASGILYLGKKFVDYMSGANKAVKETKNLEEELTGVKKTLNDVANTFNGNYASALGKTLATYKQLQNQYKSLTSDHKKTQWIKENADKFKELGLSVNTVNDADKILIKQSADVIEAFKLRAQAAAEAARLQDLYVKRIEAETEARKRANKKQIKAGEKVQAGDVDRFGLQEGIDYQQYKHTVGMFYTDAGAMKAQQALAASNIRTYTKEFDEEIQASAERLEKAESEYNAKLGKLGVTPVGSKDPKVIKEQVTELQRLNKIIKDLEDKKETISPLDTKATDKIKELDKQIREAKSNAENFKIFIDYELDQKDYAKLQGLTGEINKIKNQIDDLDKTSPDYLKQFDELNNKLKAAEKNLSDFRISVGIDVSSETFEKLQELSNKIQNVKDRIVTIKLNPNTEDYDKQLQEAEDELEELTGQYNDIKLNLDTEDYDKQLQEAEDELEVFTQQYNDIKLRLDFQIKNDPNKFINTLKAEQNKFEDAYKIAVSIGDKEAQKTAKEGYEKLQKEIGKYEIEIKNIKLSDVEIEENKLKAKLDKAMEDWKLAVKNNDEAAEEAAREAVIVAQRELNEHNLKFKFEFNPDGMTKAEKDINKIFSDLNKNEKQYDISFLPDSFKDQAEEVINRLKDIKDARQRLQDIIDSNKDKALVDPEAADAIQRAQAALAATDGEYQKLIADAEKFNQVSAGIKERQKDFESFKNTVSSISNVIGTFDSVVSSINSMTNAFEEGKNGWEQFMAVVQTAMSIMNAVITVMEIVNTIQDIMNAKKQIASTSVAAEAAAHAANATAQGTEAGTTAALAGVQTAAVAPAIALGQAMEKLAAANIFAAHSYIPFAGPAIAAGFVAMMEAVLATVGKLNAFAKGGVVPGSSYTGDKILVRVNSGERILTAKQNENLEKIANGVNGQGIVTEQRIHVIGKIKGTDILLVSKNTNKLLSKSGTNISF